jgi:mRNA interferase MazF
MKNSDIVTALIKGDYGKPRPVVVVQSNKINETESVLVCLLSSETSKTYKHRFTIRATAKNGLKVDSQVMIDKITSVPRKKCGKVIGKLTRSEKSMLNNGLLLILGLAD